MTWNQCVICSKRKMVTWKMMTHDRPDCTHEFSCSDRASLIMVTLMFFSKRDTSSSPHPARPTPAFQPPAVPCTASSCGHDSACDHALKWFRKSIQLKLAAAVSLGYFLAKLSAPSLLPSCTITPAQSRGHHRGGGEQQHCQAQIQRACH